MKYSSLSAFVGASLLLPACPVEAQTIVITDSTTTVTTPPLLVADGTVSFEGDINVTGAIAIDFNAVPTNVTINFSEGSSTQSDTAEAFRITGPFTGSITTGGTISSGLIEAILFTDSFNGTFVNTGEITSPEEGLLFRSAFTGDFTNHGQITGSLESIDFENSFNGNFINTGTLSNPAGDGLDFDNGINGSFLNSGNISGLDEGVDIGASVNGSFTNEGTITSINAEGVEITGYVNGAFLNSGTISSVNNSAVYLDESVNGSFSNSGTIHSDNAVALYLNQGVNGSFSNSGTIRSVDDGGLYLDGNVNGTWTNEGLIEASSIGVEIGDRINGEFLNTGEIRSLNDIGVYLVGAGNIFGVGDSVTFTNTGTIEGAEYGVYLDDTFNGAFINAGTIRAGEDSGIYFGYELTGSFTNAGIIEAEEYGIYFDDYFTGDFTNTGTIRSTESDGVYFYYDIEGDFVNTGQIIGDENAFYLDEGMVGDFTNTGLLQADSGNAVEINGDIEGDLTNTGVINAGEQGIYIQGDFTGDLVNSGSITAKDGDGIDINDDFEGDFLNTGTIRAIDAGADEAGDGVDIEGTFLGSVINAGRIEADDDGMEFDDFEGTFLNSGTILSGEDGFEAKEFVGSLTNLGAITTDDDGVQLNSLEGSFINTGNIIVGGDGLDVEGDFNGSFFNTGVIRAGDKGVELRNFTGNFTNLGSITGDGDGVSSRDFSGTLVNQGVIESREANGVEIRNTNGTLINDSGRISGAESAIRLGDGNGTVVLKGFSQIDGIMRGGDGTDVLRVEAMRGISAEKREELLALAAADDPGTNSVTLFGETLSWTEFEDFQVDADTLVSYGSLITRPGLESFGSSLDNVLGLTDEGRDFLAALGELDGPALNDAAANLAGQTLVDGLGDFVQNQGSQLASLFGGQFSSRRSGGSSGASIANRGERTGLFTREVQVGATIEAPLETKETFVTGYYGTSDQSANGFRSGASADNASVIFGITQEARPGLDLGLWGGYMDNRATVDEFGSYLRNEAGLFGIHAQLNNEFYFANLVLGYGFHDQLSTRRDFTGNVFDGDAIGHQALLNAQVGKTFTFGEENRGAVSPYLGAAASSLWMGGFEETSPALNRLRFSAEDSVSAQGILGVTFEGYHETRKGWLRPRLDLSWWHEFADANSYGVSLATPGFLNAFQVTSPVANRDRAVVQAGMEFAFDHWENVRFEANYFGTFGADDYTSHGGSFSAVFEF